MTATTFVCSRCGQEHPGPPMAYASTAPGAWFEATEATRARSRLQGELCLLHLGNEPPRFFLRANIEIPITDAEEPLVFSAWVALDEPAFRAAMDLWESPDRGTSPGIEGLLANDLAGYPSTMDLPVEVQFGGAGERPRGVVVPSDHPLAVDHWEAIDPGRLQAVAELLAHPEAPRLILGGEESPEGAETTPG